MNFYQFHIGDYAAATAHLEPLEDLAYRRLLDMYYDLQGPIPTAIPWVSRRIRLGSEIVQRVLEEYFELTDVGYRNTRADREIERYTTYIAKQQSNAKLGGRPRKNPRDSQTEPTAIPPVSQKNPNHQPSTINQNIDDDGRRAHDIVNELVNFLGVGEQWGYGVPNMVAALLAEGHSRENILAAAETARSTIGKAPSSFKYISRILENGKSNGHHQPRTKPGNPFLASIRDGTVEEYSGFDRGPIKAT